MGQKLPPWVIERQMMHARALARRQQELKRSMQDNAEYQQRKAMNTDAKMMSAIERLALNIREFNNQLKGTDTSFDVAKQKALLLANKMLRDKK